MSAHDAALLAFDTSTEILTVAAAGPQGSFAVNLPGGAAASAQLLPQIELVLVRAGLRYSDLEAIAFGQGPGAFTGLRTSCAVAQGLGLGLARPLLPLDSLLIVAEDALPESAGARRATVAVAMDARMDEIYGAVYERDEGQDRHAQGEKPAAGWRTLHAPALYTLAAWNALIEAGGHTLHGLAGSAWSAFGARLRRPAGVIEWPDERDRAGALLRLALRAWRAGAAVDAAAALPLYLRDKVALTTAERELAKAAATVQPSARRGGIGAAT